MDDARKPVAGTDYPATWSQFLEQFGEDAACARYLERLRWPTGFACTACGVVGEPYRASRGRLMCRACSHQGSVTAGTIFDKTRTPLKVWFAAIWYLTSQKHGVSALGLQRVLGLGSYQTAWTILHRLRRAMVRPERERLRGVVEVDEVYVDLGDRELDRKRLKGKGEMSQLIVAVAAEVLQPKGIGRIRLRRIESASGEHVPIKTTHIFRELRQNCRDACAGTPRYLIRRILQGTHELEVVSVPREGFSAPVMHHPRPQALLRSPAIANFTSIQLPLRMRGGPSFLIDAELRETSVRQKSRTCELMRLAATLKLVT